MTFDCACTEWLNPGLVAVAARRPAVAEFLGRVDGTLDDAIRVLDARGISAITTGWGGATLRADTAAGPAVIKVPLRPERFRIEADGCRRLHAAGLGPEHLGEGDGWYAVRYIDAPAVGAMFSRAPLDIERSCEVVAALAAQPTIGIGSQFDYLATRVDLDDERRQRLASVGMDADAVADVVASEFVELTGDRSRWGFCHGDLHCGNLLATPQRWTLIDSGPALGPREHDVALLAYVSWCGTPDRRWLREVCAAGELDPVTVERWMYCVAAFLLGAALTVRGVDSVEARGSVALLSRRHPRRTSRAYSFSAS